MGNCLKSKHKNENEASTKSPDTKTDVEKPTEILGKKPKSWELRGKLNKEDYQYINRENEVLYKKPGFTIFFIWIFNLSIFIKSD